MTVIKALPPCATLNFYMVGLMPLDELRNMHQQSLLVSAFVEGEMVCFHRVWCKDVPEYGFNYRQSTSM
jgi:hypothetical protein